MSFTTVNIPANVTMIPVDTRTIPKVLNLPVVSTNAGRILYFKDYHGTSLNSSFTLSTTGVDLIDESSARYEFKNNYGLISLLSDGQRSWRVLNFYIPPPPFSPTSIAGGFLWVDASLLTGSDNSSVTTWNSATPLYSYSMSGSASLRTSTLNGRNVLQFNTTQNMSISSSIYNASFTFFFVSRQTGGTNGRVFFGDGNTLYGYWGGYKSVLYMEGWLVDLGSSPLSDTVWDIYTITRNSSGAGNFWRYGSLISSYGSSGSGLQNFFINTGGSYPNEKSDCQVAEVLLFTTTVSDSDCRKVEGYLAWKWGLQANLPSGHPYKNVAP